jgi:hypothetical protein
MAGYRVNFTIYLLCLEFVCNLAEKWWRRQHIKYRVWSLCSHLACTLPEFWSTISTGVFNCGPVWQSCTGGTVVTAILRKLQDNADVFLTHLCVPRCVSSGLDTQHSIHSILIAEITAFPSIGVLTVQHMITSWKKWQNLTVRVL